MNNLQEELPLELVVDDDIILRVKKPEFALELFTLIQVQRDYLLEWLPWVEHVTSPAAQELSLRQFYNATMKGEAYETLIFYKGQVAGSLSFNEISHLNHQADIGYWLSADLKGRGIMTKSVAKLIKFGFGQLKLHKITLVAAVENQPSNAVAKRVGMTLEATLREQILLKSGYHDVNYYSIFA
ncbi:hypothetical protein FC62_GL000431 [Amylolactobacillus amylotrophicus DSM 20534]|uniref:Uncharacterized protein n=3 Tax=Amylolactobacillus TaxID=2767876 RepID=A0A0R1YJC3_9LACO|nr:MULTISPECIES: GNAT family protein [Amylolactobacillus]APT18996.1 hypothetical protein LA20533_06940 [Amylolactobacillus amylophilus DSM 20533 = JCM 1125]KRK38741.1 hypothetical protein FC62_GL000431 [Amylolactobacillus amylotrophicus DSM 20534]KRM42616.1 hypothetical protein FD40_GL000408 [Amylolactobacillus amylophilus DSM 20533 = JCM 1125]GED79961.1 ribosomal protein acetylating enzyme [Amylolactobacillus amylophilus]